MRLSPKEVDAIKSAFNAVINSPFKLYLFGSRLDNAKKGGDIDLLILVGAAEKQKVVDLKNQIRSKIFEKIPEQKIDITVATEEESLRDSFLISIMGKAVVLI